MLAARSALGRAVRAVPAAARSMAGGASSGGKTPPYKHMRGVVRALPQLQLLDSCSCVKGGGLFAQAEQRLESEALPSDRETCGCCPLLQGTMQDEAAQSTSHISVVGDMRLFPFVARSRGCSVAAEGAGAGCADRTCGQRLCARELPAYVSERWFKGTNDASHCRVHVLTLIGCAGRLSSTLHRLSCRRCQRSSPTLERSSSMRLSIISLIWLLVRLFVSRFRACLEVGSQTDTRVRYRNGLT